MKKILLIGIIGLLLQSCLYEDKGNYDYDYLPEFVINGVDEDYGEKLLAQDSLVICPEIVFTGESEDVYEYAWYKKVNKELKLLGEHKVLKYLPDDVGVHNFRFLVKHKPTGLTCWADTRCNVYSETERGFYILKQTKEGNTELDAFWHKADGRYVSFENVLTNFTKIGALEGHPLCLDYNKFRYDNQERDTLEVRNALFVVTPKDIAVLDLVSLQSLCSYEDLFNEVMPEKDQRKIQGLYSLESTTVLIYEGEDGKHRVRTRQADKHTTFGFEFEGGDPHMFPMGCKSVVSSFIFYNREKGDFLLVNGSSSRYKVVNQTIDDKYHLFGKLPMMAVDCDLLFGGQSDGQVGFSDRENIGYALFQKRNATDSLLFYWFAPKEAIFSVYTPLYKIDTLSAKNLAMAKATYRTIHQDGGIMYFASGNTVSRYDLRDKKEKYGVLTVSGEITWMKYLRNDYTDKPLRFSSLLIATYDAATDSYTLGLYGIDSSGNPLPTPEVELKGSGRVKTAKYVVPVNLAGKQFFPNYYYY